MKAFVILLGAMPFLSISAIAQQHQYHPPTIVAPPNQAPVVVPPTVIMAGDAGASKKSCRENVIDLLLFSWRTTSGDCNP